ncbi:MAG: putative Zn finger-like uncharacterized protein [Akkermansiaceae bacterium]|jgi:predicted Zn finger-like uncharacterized protein
MNLQIQCPKCTKRFTVSEDLTGKTVECGACDHRFLVKADSQTADHPKFYPGEHRKDEFLNRLGKDTNVGEAGSKKTEAPSYVPQVDAIMPASAGQNIAICSGVALIVLYSLIFFLGSDKGQAFQDVSKDKRIILGGFVSLLGGSLIIIGAQTWRVRATLLAVVLIAGLFAMIVMRKVYLTPTGGEGGEIEKKPVVEEPLDESELKERVGFTGMQRKIDAMVEKHGGEGVDYVVGIFIEDLSGREYYEIEKYLVKALSIPPSEGIGRYRRNGEKDSLLVISGLRLDFDTIVRKCDPRLGRATTYPELRLLDLKLSSTLFAEPSDGLLRKLTDSEQPAFFSTNLDELSKLDPTLVRAAVTRLANVRPGIALKHEEKIVSEFVRILSSEDDPTFLSDLGKALRIWAGNRKACVDIVVRKVEQWLDDEAIVPKSFIDYLTDNDAEESLAFVDRLWEKEPEVWNSQYEALGSAAEIRLTYHVEVSPDHLKKAAARILAKTGTSKALPALEKLQASGDEEAKILAEKAMEAIKSR